MYNANGEEVLDQTPVNVPIKWKAPLPLNERIKQMVRQEASQWAQQQGNETFEDADDFNVPDDPPDPSTPWEEDFDPQVPFVATREAEIRHGAVQDLDESKINRGMDELAKLKKPKAKPAAVARSAKENDDEGTEEDTETE